MANFASAPVHVFLGLQSGEAADVLSRSWRARHSNGRRSRLSAVCRRMSISHVSAVATAWLIVAACTVWSPPAHALYDYCTFHPGSSVCQQEAAQVCAADPTSQACYIDTLYAEGIVCTNYSVFPPTGCGPYQPPVIVNPNVGSPSTLCTNHPSSDFAPSSGDPTPQVTDSSGVYAMRYQSAVQSNSGPDWTLSSPSVIEGGWTFQDTSIQNWASSFSTWQNENQLTSVSFDGGSSFPVQSSSDWPSTASSFDMGGNPIDSIAAGTAGPAAGDTNSVANSGCVGNPINPATGNKFEVQRDYVGLGPFPPRFLRYYNSAVLPTGAAATDIGVGWRTVYDRSVQVLTGQSTPSVRVVRADGQSLLFTNNGTGWVSADPAVTSTLVVTAILLGTQTGWTYATPDDMVESYDLNGRLVSIANRAGLQQTLSYDANGRLVIVTDPFGHQLLLAYDSSGRIVQMTDPGGGLYGYSYDASSNLIAVAYPDSTTRQYLYENASFPNALTGLIDETGSRFATWTYDSQGRAVSSAHVGGVQPVGLTFNSDGSTSVTDARGATRVHQFTTTAAGSVKATSVVASCTGCTPISSSLSYDANGFLNGSVDPNGTTSSYSFNARGLETNRAEATNSALSRSVSITWHPTFHVPTQITYPDRVISFTYDGVGNRLTKTVTAGATTRTWSYAYNSRGLLTQVTGPRTDVAQVTSLTYDGFGHLTSVTNPLGQVLKFNSYDASGRPLSITDPNGVTSQLTYDARGRVISRTASGRTWSFQRDALGQVTAITYPNGSVTHLGYDSAHRLTDATDALGNRRHRTLDAAGDAVQLQLLDPSNNLVRQQSFAFDGYGRIVTTTDANGKSTTLAYDNNGNVVSTTDALAHTRSVLYDVFNRPTSATDPLGQVTSISYNAYNQPLQVTAANAAVSQFSYDNFGQMVQEVSPDRGSSTVAYSNAGLPLSRTDARGVTASISYDAANRPTAVSYAGGPGLGPIGLWLQSLGTSIVSDNVSFSYDQGTGCSNGVGRLCSRSDQSGTERFGYDAFGNVVQQVDVQLGFTYTTQYAFDAANQLTQMTYPDGRIVNYTTDALERITSVAATVNHAPASVLSSVQYGADGSLLGMTYGNGLAESRTYDPVGRMVNQLLGAIDSRSYTFDAVGSLTSKQTTAEADQFSYDSLNRLISEQRIVGSNTSNNVFSYDPNGNRLSETITGVTTPLSYTPNTNRLAQFGSSPITLDGAGNTISDSGGSRKFYYSSAGHLQWISQNGIPIAGYLYNGLGQRTGKLTLQGISLYHYDIAGRLIGETTIGSQPSRDYIWAGGTPVEQINHWVPIGNMLQMEHCSTGADGMIDWVTYLHTDGLGSPRVGTDIQQNVVWRWDGEAFGETAPTQAVPAGAYPVYVNLRHSGQYLDQETALFYNGARYYNPKTGRYITSDPIGLAGGANSYAYARGNPGSKADPTGLDVTIQITRMTYSSTSIISTISVWSSFSPITPFSGYTLENAGPPNPSLPVWPGSYSASMRLDYSPNRIQLNDVPWASGVQIHNGNTVGDVVGCFAAGTSQSTNFVGGSVNAMGQINNIISADGTGNITVIVSDGITGP